MSDVKKTLLVWDDLQCGVRYWPFDGRAESVVMDFEVIEIFGGSGAGIEWVNDSGPSAVPVRNHEEATLFMSGGLKWDGCMNMRFDEQDRVYLHFCGKGDAVRIGQILGRIYDVIGPLIPRWDAP